eukprot:TRINITY_DN746_c0_g1_i3.p2 TRINITY_DN746_c0_g1~~TRINITY_DN746_c0_g1_i3.p2  ORF type:complete len:162 (-),score=26.98 TRINITY_DN746_c0_g1_i3:1656-2141(-)
MEGAEEEIAGEAFPVPPLGPSLADIPPDLLHEILARLSFPNLLRASQVCKAWATATEPLFHGECRRKRWALPRRPRGKAAASSFPWRGLYAQHACRSCGRPGEFPVRLVQRGPLQLLLCRPCLSWPPVRQRLIANGLRVDLIGVSGKALFSKQTLRKTLPK